VIVVPPWSNHRLERAVTGQRTGRVLDRPLNLIVRLPVNPYALVLPCIGYSAGAVGGYLLSRRIIRRLSSDSFKPRLVVWFGVAMIRGASGWSRIVIVEPLRGPGDAG
jgi:hypothetical protein